MTIRNLDGLFRPRSVALVGASARENSVGHMVARNLLGAGFEGPVMLVHPSLTELLGHRVHPDVASLPETPDLAVIATPAETVPDLVSALGDRGTRGVVVISAGFGESGAEGRALQQAVLEAARPHLVRVLGPNCLGLLVPGAGLNASFAHLRPRAGGLAFLTQSGAIVTSVLDWAEPRGIGFSKLVSMGDTSDVDFGDLLDYLANDRDTRAILLYMESVGQTRKFMSAARAAARTKPVIVVKSGRFRASADAAASHTGAMAGSDAVYDAAFRRAGMLRVYELGALFDAAELLAQTQRLKGERLLVVTNGGGIGVMAIDELLVRGGTLAELSESTLQKLDDRLPATASRRNPVDLVGDAGGDRYEAALDAVLADPGVDATLVLHCPVAVTSPDDVAQAIVRSWERAARPSLLTSFVGEASMARPRELLSSSHIPTFDTPEQAVQGFMYLVDHRRSQATLMETPPSIPQAFSPDVGAARRVVRAVLEDEREWLNEIEAKEVLSAYGLPVARAVLVDTPRAAAEEAVRIGGPVALKVVSPDILHKSDVGGVALDLQGPAAVLEAAERMQATIRERRPEDRFAGFAVEPMVKRPGAHELILGAVEDPQFGPVMLFGHGGTGAERVDDKAIGFPPLNLALAREMMAHTRIHRVLEGGRGKPGVNLDEIAMALIRLAQLVTDLPEIKEVDVNPVLADRYGTIAVDARMRVAPEERPGDARLAIRPYPKELEETVTLPDGRSFLLRPIMPEDEPALRRGFARLSPEEIRFRFHVPKTVLDHVTAARFTQIDYDREMALVLTHPGPPGTTEGYGVVRLSADPDNEQAEFAIILERDYTGRGLGHMMMSRIIDYARRRGIGELYGDVLRENRAMLQLADSLGFRRRPLEDDPSVIRVTKDLTDA